MKILIYLLAVLFVFPVSLDDDATTWGKTGHRVVGKIAAHYLTPQAQKAVTRILDGPSMAMASIWMDQIRSNPKWDYTHPWHYVTIPKGMTYEATEKNPDGDIIWAIRMLIDDLKSSDLSPQEEKHKLKMLIHLIGDLHMPLHVGNGKDRGGNLVTVIWYWEPSNLHHVWDSGMINETQLSYTELAGSINHPTQKQVQKWQGTSILDWAYESRALLDEVYDLPKDHKINYEYMYHNYPIVQKRLLLAGVRLAGVLNEIYGE